MAKRLSQKVKKCLEKAMDSALLAVETYNKPAVKFKSGSYVVLMIIAWTSLFHAIFFRQKIKPFYKDDKNKNRYKRIEGDYAYWELRTCVKEYFGSDTNNPIRKNLEFFIPLRNMIEHKSLPEIDADIFAECQSLLLNFDNIIKAEFGNAYCLRESLSFALQLFPSNESLENIVEAKPDSKQIVSFIKKYRSSISTEIINSGEYSFKAFLIQVNNHESSGVLPIQFIQYDKLNENQKKNIDRIAALIKNRVTKIPISNKDLLKPSKVVEKVQERLGDPKIYRNCTIKNKFNMDAHIRCWKKYRVRPKSKTSNPENTNTNYCIYDEPNNNYLYTMKWVNFLVDKMSDDNEYQSLYK